MSFVYSSVCHAEADVVFILDSSGSVGQDNFYRVLNFTYSTIDSLDIDSGQFRVGVVTFSDTSRLDFNLDEFDNKRDMEQALTQVKCFFFYINMFIFMYCTFLFFYKFYG